ncbi:peptide ABC transporter substrate-binding protein [Thomasclavelia sp.]|uniref:peptide ABC transporter substrate-binding protein n=1 Tax=Thomasclavelia sp. TaxID=3025757 RepID=UPI0025DBBCBD|nr:peptide ABC transporter substrate-binding protein [Thomasclavelia sp.]
MKKLLAYGLSFIMALTVLTGCGGGSQADLRVAVGGDTADLDPAIVDDSITANILAQAYQGLYKLSEDGDVVPNLATDMPEISADGLTYTIKIPSGLKWSDGSKLTANDFVYAWKRAVTTGGYYTQFIYQYITGTTYMKDNEDGTQTDTPYTDIDKMKEFGAVAVDDTTIQITLKAKCSYFTALLTNTVFYPVQEKYITENAKDGDITTSSWANNDDVPYNGAFKVTSVNTKDEVFLEKNEEFAGADDVSINSISFKVMSDMDAQVSAFQNDEIDFATACNVDTINKDKDLQENLWSIDPFICNYYILINAGDENTNEALKDVDIRNALSLAINRDDVLQALGYGDMAYELSGLIPKGIPGATGDFREEQDATQKLATYDLEQAKQIMASKGYSENNMLELTYKYNDLTMHKNVAQALQASLKEAYVNVELVAEEKEAFFADRDEGNFEICRHAMTGDFVDPMAYLSMYVGSSTPGNTVDDAKFEELVNAANAIDDHAGRMNALHAAENYLVAEQHYIIPLFGYTEPYLLSSKVSGITHSPEGHFDLTKATIKE